MTSKGLSGSPFSLIQSSALVTSPSLCAMSSLAGEKNQQNRWRKRVLRLSKPVWRLLFFTLLGRMGGRQPVATDKHGCTFGPAGDVHAVTLGLSV